MHGITSAPAGADSRNRSSSKAWLLAGLCVAQLMVSLDGTIVNVALPSIRADLSMSADAMQWIANGYMLSFACLLLFGGRAADVLGRRSVFLAGLAVFTAASLAGGLINSGSLLILVRVLQGVGAAALSPATVSLLAVAFTDPDQRRRALGAWTAASTSGNAVGTVLGGLLTQLLNWHWVLLVNVPIGLGLLVLAIVVFPRDRAAAKPDRSLDLPGAVTVSLGCAAIVYGTVLPLGSPLNIATLAGGITLLVAFVMIEHRGRRPLLPLRLFRIRSVLSANGIALLLTAGMSPMFYFLSQYMQSVLHMSPLLTGLFFLPSSLGMLVGSQLGTRLLPVLGHRRLLVAAGAVELLGALWLARLPVNGSYVNDILLPLLLVCIALGSGFVPVTVASVSGVPSSNVGVASGLLGATQRVGGSFGLALLATIAAAWTASLPQAAHVQLDALVSGYRIALLGCAAFALVSLLFSFLMPSIRKRPNPGVPNAQVLRGHRDTGEHGGDPDAAEDLVDQRRLRAISRRVRRGAGTRR